MTKWQEAYMDVVFRFAELSTARKMKVGAIAVKEDRIISIGYNGMPSGWTNECETVRPPAWAGLNWEQKIHPEDVMIYCDFITKPEVIHAEANCIAKLARSNESGNGATMYITHAPCLECAKQIYTAGIIEVYYRNGYRCSKGIEFLNNCQIKVEQI